MRLNLAGGVIAALIIVALIVAYGRSSSVGFDRYRVGPDPNTEGL
jgi:uncharacterized protein (DUF697 family)